MLAANVYAEGLAHLGYGYPLWIPEPVTGIGPVLIGDVGYMLDGRFYRLFNVTRSASDPVNSDGVPANFSVLPFDDNNPRTLHRVEKLIPSGSAVCSKSVRKLDVSIDGAGGSASTGLGFAYSFACREDKGALLILKDHATGEQLHPTNKTFIEYMSKHYSVWCKFASEKCGLSLEPEEIILVRGWVKTTEWAVASFLHGCSSHELSFHSHAGSFASATFSIASSEERSAQVLHRIGPNPDECTGACTPERNQCIFLSFFKLKRAFPLVPLFKIVAGAEPEDDPSPPASSRPNSPVSTEARSDLGHSYGVESYPTLERPWDPLDAVLDPILQNSSAKVAITSQMSLRGLEWPQDNDLRYILDKIRPNIALDTMQGMLQAEAEGFASQPELTGTQHLVATVTGISTAGKRTLDHQPEPTLDHPSSAQQSTSSVSFDTAKDSPEPPQYHQWQTTGYYPFEGQGFIVPQIVYVPQTPTRNFIPHPKIPFYDTTTGLFGIPLDKALRQDFSGLADWVARPTTTHGGNKIGIRILWPGHDTWTVHMNAQEAVSGVIEHITKARLAHEVAKRIRDFHRDMSTVRSADPNQSWWLGSIPLNQLVLLELRNVSPGSWQPVIIWRI